MSDVCVYIYISRCLKFVPFLVLLIKLFWLAVAEVAVGFKKKTQMCVRALAFKLLKYK